MSWVVIEICQLFYRGVLRSNQYCLKRLFQQTNGTSRGEQTGDANLLGLFEANSTSLQLTEMGLKKDGTEMRVESMK